MESVVLYPGERFDFVLDANVENITNHWIRMNGITRCYRIQTHQTAILRYKGAPDVVPDEPDEYDSGNRDGVVRILPLNKFDVQSKNICFEIKNYWRWTAPL